MTMQNKQNISEADVRAALRAQLAALESKVSVLAADNESLAKDNAALASDLTTTKREYEGQVAHWKAECDKLIEQIKLANMRYFGSSSERVIPDQLSFFNEMEAYADPTVQESALDEVLDQKPRRRGGKRVLGLSKLETVVVGHALSEDERHCPECDTVMDEFKCEVIRVVKMVPAHLIVEEHHRQVYVCRPCSKQNAEDGSVPAQFMRATMPNLPIERSFASASLIAYILHGKYVNALPLYRMEKDFKYLGLSLSRQNMANWVISVHEKWLRLIHARMKEKLLEGNIVHCDETECQVLKEPNREAKQKSRMWLFCAPACDIPSFIYEYHTSRKGSVAEDFFKGWSGTIATDGYSPYFKLGSSIDNTACLVHVRRKFQEIVKVAGGEVKAASSSSAALQARRMIDEIFDDMEPDERYRARLENLAPKMYAFEAWARVQIDLAVPKMALHKALAYALKYWPYVKNVLKDGRLGLSNNIAERAIRHYAIGRKNHLFSDTPKGAHASAAIYSIVTTAKMNGLNPRLYLEWLLDTLPNTDHLDDPTVIDGFMPWSDQIPDTCRMSPESAEKAAKMGDDPIIDIDVEAFDSED